MTTTTEPRLRVSEVPQMVDVDGHIDEQLLRYGEGVTVRPMFQTIPLDDFEWNPADAYDYSAADQYLPQPPRALEGWERELHGVPTPRRRLSAGGCTCALCQNGAALFGSRPPNMPEVRELNISPGRLWFIPTVQNPSAPTLAELEAATELNAVPRRIALGFDGSRQGSEVTAVAFDEAQVTSWRFDPQPIDSYVEQLRRARAQLASIQRAQEALRELTAESIRFRLDRWIPSKPLAPDEVRERALTLRQSRNTGPAQVPFRHRGGR